MRNKNLYSGEGSTLDDLMSGTICGYLHPGWLIHALLICGCLITLLSTYALVRVAALLTSWLAAWKDPLLADPCTLQLYSGGRSKDRRSWQGTPLQITGTCIISINAFLQPYLYHDIPTLQTAFFDLPAIVSRK